MAMEFIGSIVTVTLLQPPNAQARGFVEGITEGQRLDLRDVTLLASGTSVASLSISPGNIKDLNIEPDTISTSPRKPSAQPLTDPAILSFDRVGEPSNVTPTSSRLAREELHPPSSTNPTIPSETKPLDEASATATLTRPFSDLTLNGDISTGANPDQEVETPLKAGTGKRRRRRPTKTLKEDLQVQTEQASRTPELGRRGHGWGEPPFLQENTSSKKAHPLDAPIHRAEQRLAQVRRGRRQNPTEERNGWATEDATDIQDMGDFDFQGNLSKFDKRGVFEQIRQDDTTADEDRLVSFNRLLTRPGTNGGKNLHYTENVLESPKPNGRVSWNDESGSEISDDRFSSGRSSRRNLSRASTRKPPSRKGSAIVPHDHTSSSGFPQRYSSQEHPSPRIKVNKSASRHMRSDGSYTTLPTFKLAASGAHCPCVTPLQMLELEQLATSELGLSDDMMTENAGHCIAQLARKTTTGERVVILAGNTKSGARAIAAGRHLKNHGMRVLVFVLGIEREDDLLEIVKRQVSIYRNSGGQLANADKLVALGKDRRVPTDLIVDALLGMHLSFEDLRTADQNAFYEVAVWVNKCKTSVVAVDIPSGLDAASGSTTGSNGNPDLLIRPTHVLALGAPKAGLLTAMSQLDGSQKGPWKLFVADIGICNSVWKKFGTRRRYGITHSEWASEDAYSASAGSGVSKSNSTSNAPFKRLPFNFCAVSLQPFNHPVCSPEGTIFDITHILPWLKKHGTNPVTAAPLKPADLIELHFAKNEDGEMVDPVTFKVFTDNTHLVALKNTGNVFAYDTIDRLNIKAKNWRDLVSEEEFSRKDIITLQDPQNVESRNLSAFKYLQEGADTAAPEQQRERNDPSRNVNTSALGNGASLLKPNAKKQAPDINPDALASNKDSISRTLSAISSSKPQRKPFLSSTPTTATNPTPSSTQAHALHTTGRAAASLTSTGLTPHTTADLATLSQETYLLHPRRVRAPGYVLLTLTIPSPSSTVQRSLTLELAPEFAPQACYNFLSLARSGYYNATTFHRNIPSFMIQGGDPTGTGRGGTSSFANGKTFSDELDGPLKFDKRGVLAMANKGKNTNSSQFFITYRPCLHLARKHTIFGRVVMEEEESTATLAALEKVETDSKSGKPVKEIKLTEARVL
ncbi:MAG: hypothetical protein L6R35_005419, partial [Caloplaca aegaea]